MKELKCPNCGHVFRVDREMFQSIAEQIRDAAFEDELQQRLSREISRLEAENEVKRLKEESKFKAEIDSRDHKLELSKQQIARLDNDLKDAKKQIDSSLQTERLKVEAELNRTITARETEIAELKSKLSEADSRQKIALLEAKGEAEATQQKLALKITTLENELNTQATQAKLREAEINEQHAMIVRQKDEQITFYKDMKVRLSTKMIGESLEQHCETVFKTAQQLGAFPSGVLTKDNDASRGSKGDYIYRDYDDDGNEVVSIMFEMKNEADATATKHRNSDFFDKLDHDRNEKNCEYAVLVSLLERDSDLYNAGLVAAPPQYEKMYVVRPQMFTSIIALISQTARKNMALISSLRNDLEIARAQSIDVTNFEKKRDEFVSKFGKLLEDHGKRHEEAIEGIDKVIANLEKQVEQLKKVKNAFDTSRKKLERANESAENDFTIKKLTRGNPTMKEKFEEARKLNQLDAPAEE